MQRSQVLAVLIVAFLLLFFIGWVVGTVFAFTKDFAVGVSSLLPGLIFFGFNALVVYDLWNCKAE